MSASSALESLKDSTFINGGGDATQQYIKTEENLAMEPAVINHQLKTDRS